MIRICAWCNTVLKQTAIGPPDATTHTICRHCWNNMEFQQGVSLIRFLNSLPLPVLVISDAGRVRTANTTARRVLGKTLAQVRGRLGGEVFECQYARLPGGCGRTIHCSGCAIRHTVMETFRTGESQYRVPATLNSCRDDNPVIHYLISTRKEGNVVLLQVDEADALQITAPAH